MIELILLLQADRDVQSAFERYENYQPGRGEVFMRQLDIALTLLRQHPELVPVYAGPYRRMLPTRLIVAAIMDLRQNPQTIRKKLSGPGAGQQD